MEVMKSHKNLHKIHHNNSINGTSGRSKQDGVWFLIKYQVWLPLNGISYILSYIYFLIILFVFKSTDELDIDYKSKNAADSATKSSSIQNVV